MEDPSLNVDPSFGSEHVLGLGRHLGPGDLRRLPMYRFDVVVLGSGAAGSSVALGAAAEGASVALLAKAQFGRTNTHYAQGGVAAVLHAEDSLGSHVEDTLRVGRGLANPSVVEHVVGGGPGAIERLIAIGANFDLDTAGAIDLSREGGHSQPRIVHAGGAATGIEIQRVLTDAVASHPEIAVFERTFAIDLLTSEGTVTGVLARTERDELAIFAATEVVLATGGAGQLYRETTNPEIATGDGLALAFRAGAMARDLEFVQFHPTCLYIAGAARVLISEVVRGAGGVLRDKGGRRFMPDYHKKAELAPRDVVSSACFDRMVETQDTSVYLDLSAIERDPHQLFPGISKICSLFRIDIARDPIPVRPGAHYWIGGVATDLAGRTSVHGLWAVGECASSGLHGANRMGSNSLLEALVLGDSAGRHAGTAARSRTPIAPDLMPRPSSSAPPAGVHLGIEDMTYSLKSLMWRQMGIVRDEASLTDALRKVVFWTQAVRELAGFERRSVELSNMLTLAQLATHGALARTESRGVHGRKDHPEASSAWCAHTVFRPIVDAGEVARVRLERVPVTEPVPTS